jgi:hypothetical protein
MGLFDRFKKDKAPDPIKTLDMRGHKNSKTDKIMNSYQQMGAAKAASMISPWYAAGTWREVDLTDNERIVIADMLKKPYTKKGSQLICSLPDDVLAHALQHIDQTIADIESSSSGSISARTVIGYLEDWYEVVMEEQGARQHRVPLEWDDIL